MSNHYENRPETWGKWWDQNMEKVKQKFTGSQTET